MLNQSLVLMQLPKMAQTISNSVLVCQDTRDIEELLRTQRVT
jgi:hypothetical protein